MSRESVTRRLLLKELATVGSLAVVAAACGKRHQIVCADPAQLTAGAASLRASLHYAESSPDPPKTCSACGFFSAPTAPGCGRCQMLNGPVNANGYCDSWSAKS